MKLARLPSGEPEIFHTLQGEGRHAGTPSVFIRASLCNLSCVWCDTDYTWNWEGTDYRHERDADPRYRKFRREDQIIELDPSDVADRASAFACPHYVLTGGEPLIQEREWVEVMLRLREHDTKAHFELETNGTLIPNERFLCLVDQINVSPKLSNSGVPVEKRRRPDVLFALAESGKADFKFVANTEADLEEIRSLVAEITLPPERIILMPRASSLAELEKRQEMVAEWARAEGWRFGDRLHLRLYGATRGT